MPTQICGTCGRHGVLRSISLLILGLGLLLTGLRMGPAAAADGGSRGEFVVRRPLPAGAVISSQDIESRTGDPAPGVPIDPSGRRTAVALAPGDALTAAELLPSGAPAGDRRIVAVSVDAATIPAGLERGDVVQIVREADGVHSGSAIATARVISIETAEHAPVRLTVETDAATAVVLAGMPSSANLRAIRAPS